MALDVDVLRHSVTREDHTDNAGRKGQVLHFWMSPSSGGLAGLPPLPPSYWSPGRDDYLRATVHYESLWSSAIYIALTKISALSWDVKGEVALQIKRAQALLLQIDNGKGWVPALQKHLRDFLLTDNGAFLEIVRSSGAKGARIVGLIPLDSRRCTRTGDPDVPIIYRDRQERWHEMKDYQVIEMADMPDPAETYFGVGLCAASRAWRAIYKLSALETYVAEKISGRRPLALHLINNVTTEQITDAIRTSEMQADSRGFTSYMGAVLVPNIDPSVTPGVATIDLAGLPDGFDSVNERRQAILAYADAIGVDPQELDPELLASKAQGTGSQSRVIDDKASSRGLIAYRQLLTHKLNWEVLPLRTWFYFHERDFRDQKQRADVDSVIIDNTAKMVQGGFVEDIEGRQLLVDKDVLPREFMPIDITPTSTMSDSDKLPPQEASEDERQAFIAQAQDEKLEQQVTEQAAMTRASTPPQSKMPVKAKENDMPDDGSGFVNIRLPKIEPIIHLTVPQAQPNDIYVNVPKAEPAQVTVNVPETIVNVAAAQVTNLVAAGETRILQVKEKPAPLPMIEKPKTRRFRMTERDAEGRMLSWEEIIE